MSASIPNRIRNTPKQRVAAGDTRLSDLVALVPDFPFNYGKHLEERRGRPLVEITSSNQGKIVAIIGGGLSGTIAAYELMRAGLKPVIFESAGRIGGRMRADRFSSGTGGFAEMGSMRFAPTCKGSWHYFTKVGMIENSAGFPNPGTAFAPGTRIQYKHNPIEYYDLTPQYPLPQKYVDLIDKWDALIAGSPYLFEDMVEYQTNPTPENIAAIKQLWNALLRGGADNQSFHDALVEADWDFDTIELFGQIGFGSGGWNTDFPNTFLEVLRVTYTMMDSDHTLFYDGSSYLPQSLYSKTAAALGDQAIDTSVSVQEITESALPGDALRTHVRDIEFLPAGGTYRISYDTPTGSAVFAADAVIYTGHKRAMQMSSGLSQTNRMRELMDGDRWEAIEYTHYMQSSKVFIKASRPFWNDQDDQNRHVMSTTLSDRLTRGTYLLDYGKGNSSGAAVMCLSYTWNDDSLKFAPFSLEQRVRQTLSVLKDVYPDISFEQVADPADAKDVSWELESNFIGGFKMNLPGQYRYQRQLFAQFAEPRTLAERRFILAGDDVSWTAGWVEGAVSTALNAVDRLGGEFGWLSSEGPLSAWANIQPLDLDA